jgi:mitochondrial import inner membrane translocase subunit TIM16
MSGRIAQILAQALIMGGGVMIKAFVEAYQRVAANPEAAKAAADQAKKSTSAFIRKEMSLREAQDILAFPNKPKSLQELNERYEKYFTVNDPKKGGSFYIQSKIYRAKEALEKEMKSESKVS